MLVPLLVLACEDGVAVAFMKTEIYFIDSPSNKPFPFDKITHLAIHIIVRFVLKPSRA